MNSQSWLITGIIAVFVLVISVSLLNQNDNNQVGLPNIGSVPPTVTPARVITIDLREQSNSSESGTAIFTEENSRVIVTLNLENAPSNIPQPAHIHLGECPEPGEIKYPLNNVVNGRSETTIETTLDELNKQLPLAINVHKSAEEQNVYVSCGNIQL